MTAFLKLTLFNLESSKYAGTKITQNSQPVWSGTGEIEVKPSLPLILILICQEQIVTNYILALTFRKLKGIFTLQLKCI